MDPALKEIVWGQFGAAIDTLENAIEACPEPLWGDRTRQPEYWYTAYHTLFWLDLYLGGDARGFAPPAPFDLAELDPAGVLPPRVYSKKELLGYLHHCRAKGRATIAALTADSARRPCEFGPAKGSFLESLLYNMRHVQHHSAQLNLLLRQTSDLPSRWVSRAKAPFPGA